MYVSISVRVCIYKYEYRFNRYLNQVYEFESLKLFCTRAPYVPEGCIGMLGPEGDYADF